MTIESEIYNALKGLVGGKCYPDIAPEGTVPPYITYQQIGGEAVNFVEPTIPSKKRSRFQINVWGNTRSQVAALAATVEDTLRLLTPTQSTVESAPIASYEVDTKLRGTVQDFSFLY